MPATRSLRTPRALATVKGPVVAPARCRRRRTAGQRRRADLRRRSAEADGGEMSEDGGSKMPPPNQTCTVAAQCASGFCVDGVCCDTACDGACQSCSLTGKVGICSPVKNATDDACTVGSTCDATGACRKDLGRSCSTNTECASGSCVDGVCCATAACATCQACAVPGFEGKCAPVARFVDDGDCSGTNSCNGQGECHGKKGRRAPRRLTVCR